MLNQTVLLGCSCSVHQAFCSTIASYLVYVYIIPQPLCPFPLVFASQPLPINNTLAQTIAELKYNTARNVLSGKSILSVSLYLYNADGKLDTHILFFFSLLLEDYT
jgi:hypothetical protein